MSAHVEPTRPAQTPERQRFTPRTMLQKVPKGIAHLILIAWAVTSLVPLVWLFLTAFLPYDSMIVLPPRMTTLTLGNFRELFEAVPILRWTFNTVVLTTTVTLFNVFFDTLAGYALSKLEFPGRNMIFWSIVATMMIPHQVTLVPKFMIIRALGLTNTWWGVILPSMAGVVGVFLMRQYLITLPKELGDAARIDGASEFRIFARIYLPLAKPGMAVLGIFIFMGEWKNLIWPLVVLRSKDLYVLEQGLAGLTGEFFTDYGVMLAGAAFSAVPMLIVFFMFQRYLVQGLSIGGSVKG